MIDTKYKLGECIFMPRVYKQYEKDTIYKDNREYIYNGERYEPFVKIKYVRTVRVIVNNRGTHIDYQCTEVDDEEPMFGYWYDEKVLDRCPKTYDDAFALAMAYSIKKEEYFG